MAQKNHRLEIFFLMFLLVAFTVFFVIGLGYPPETRRLPLIIQGVAIVLLLVQLLRILFSSPVNVSETGPAIDWWRTLLCFAVLAGALIITFLFGLIPASVFMVYGNGWVLGARKKLQLLVASLSTGIIIYLLFVRVFGIMLYGGIMFE